MRKKSENRSNIIRPLHFGHSIEPPPTYEFDEIYQANFGPHK